MNPGQVYLMKQVMQKQQDPLNLQGLPQVRPPRDGWPVIEAALRQDSRRRTMTRAAGAALAAAAVVTLAVTLVLQQRVPGSPEGVLDLALQPAPDAASEIAGSAARNVTAATLDSLIAVSQRLEGRLRTVRAGVGELPARDLVYQVELEDLVAQVDDELSAQPDSLSLWNQRVSLLQDLERLYENSLRREYRQVASL
jgi:hypothetical protein